MPSDIYGHGDTLNTSMRGEPPAVSPERRAGIVLTGMAISEGVEPDELEEILLMVGIKKVA